MHSFLTNNNQVPLASHKFLNARTLADAENALTKAVEPRRFSATKKSRKQGIQLNRYQLADIQIYGMHFDCPLDISSDQLESVNIICPITGKFTTKGEDPTVVSPGYARIDSPGDRVAVEWESSSTSIVARIPSDTLNLYCRQLYDLDAYKTIRFSPILDLSRNIGISLQNILNSILFEADNKNSLLNQGLLTEQFQETFVLALLNIQPHSLSELLHRQDRQVRPFYIKRAVEYIHENAAEMIKLSDLVAVSGVSLRSLQVGFSRYYEVGPSAYIKQVKMQKIRDELLVANPLETTVSNVAANWGFYDHSNFTGNYRKLFGENPSETLRRSK